MRKTSTVIKTAIFSILALAAASGCAGKKTTTPPILAHFVLTPIEIPVKEFKVDNGSSVFENEHVRLSAQGLDPLDKRLEKKAFKTLNGVFFMFVEFEITNKSTKPVIYKPNYTHLRTEETDYIRPSDYTAIYGILSKLRKDEAPSAAMREIHGLYYDSDITIQPGKSVKKLLVFERLSSEALGAEAGISIDDLYIGAETIDTALPFKVQLYQDK